MGTLWGLAAMGTSATSVVLGDLQDELAVGTTATAWVLTAFALAFAAATPLFGRVADSFGSRTPYSLGVVLLATGAVISAAAVTLPVLLSGRVLQGVGDGAIPVLTSTILSARFSGTDRAAALGRVDSVVVVLSSIGRWSVARSACGSGGAARSRCRCSPWSSCRGPPAWPREAGRDSGSTPWAPRWWRGARPHC